MYIGKMIIVTKFKKVRITNKPEIISSLSEIIVIIPTKMTSNQGCNNIPKNIQ